MRVVLVEPDDPAMTADVLPVLAELRPHLTAASLAAIYAEGWPQGLRFSAAYDDNGRCVGIAGWRIIASTHPVRKLSVDDLVTTSNSRSTGVGSALLADLEEKAIEAQCSMLDLDSAVHRFDAHRFYLRERMHIAAHHFVKLLSATT